MTSDDRTERIAFEGNLDAYNKDSVEAALPNPEDVDRLVIDCSRVATVESPILTVLMRYRRRWIDAGRDPFDIVVVSSPNVRRIFEITGLTRAMTVVTATEQGDS